MFFGGGGGGGGGGGLIYFFFAVAIFDLVHNVEAILSSLATNSIWKYD